MQRTRRRELNRTLEPGVEEVAGVSVSAAVHARGMPMALVAAQAQYERESWTIYTHIRSLLRESFVWQLSQTLTLIPKWGRRIDLDEHWRSKT